MAHACAALLLCCCLLLVRLLVLQACADKLDRELATYGCPPKFPSDEDEEQTAAAAAAAAQAAGVSGQTATLHTGLLGSTSMFMALSWWWCFVCT